MSGAPVATEERTSRRQQAQAPGVQEGSTGPRDIPGAGSRPHQGSRQQQQHDNAGAGSCDRRRSSGCGNGDGGGGGGRGRRYGQWPPATAGGGGAGGSTGSSPATGHRRPSGQHGGSRRGGFSWPAHMDRAELQQAMKRGRVFRAKFRVNAANRSEGFCSLEGLPADLLVRGEVNHNRAVEGDEVAVLAFKLADWFKVYREQDKLAELGLLPQGDADPLALAEKLAQLALDANDTEELALAQSPWWSAGAPATAVAKMEELLAARPDLRVTGKVVAILEPSRKREAVVGVLLPPATALAEAPSTLAPKQPAGGSGPQLGPVAAAAAAALAAGAYEGCLMLFPLDPRLPKCIVPPQAVAALPQALRDEAVARDLASRTFVTAALTEWPASSPFPFAEVRQSLGPSDDIEAGTKALLAAEQICEEDFSLETYACLPRVPWSISPEELASRADFTAWRIFSIDPITARDLDDALSIQPLGGGRWRVGVHIADVASFVRPNTELDREAELRGTSVYLVQRVIPMLPRLLCEELCSLHPGYPRCAFSIVWELDEEGHIYGEWAGRSVISSRAKLAYPMVQQMIEGCFEPTAWGVQLHEGATWEQIKFDCLALHGIASRLRAARFRSGALRMNNTRLYFALDTGGNPVAASPYVQSAANFLVEEYMLLANQRVAALIARTFPKHALLRRHPPPSQRKMKELQAVGERLGVAVRDETAGALALSLQALKDACQDDATSQALMLLATKPMQLAQYFCTATAPDPASWRHYALAIGHYTHFTSPIRRYPDVIVHRLLAAALDLAAQQQQPDGSALLQLPVVDAAEPPAAVDYSSATYDPAFAAAQQAAEAAGVAGIGGAREAAAHGHAGGGGGSSSAHGGASSDAAEEDEEQEADEADDAERDPLRAAVLAVHQLPPAKAMARIAKHSNDTKQSARAASDGSLKLYLCLMVRAAPVVTTAVAVSLGGDRFFTAYLPEYGCETRITLSTMGLPLTAVWNETTETLTLSHKDDAAAAAAEGSSGGGGGGGSSSSRRQQWRDPGRDGAAPSGQQEQQQEQQQDGDGQGAGAVSAQLRLNTDTFDLRAWLQHMRGKVLNPHCTPHLQLPLEVRQFTQLPVVLSSYSNAITCYPEDVSAKLWVDVGAGDVTAQAAAAAAAATPAAAAAAAAAPAAVGGPAAGLLAAAAGVLPSAMVMEAVFED